MKNYAELALRTESPVTIEMRERACFYLRLQHGVMGLVTEAIELQSHTDHVNLIEELGDIDWYLALIRDTVDLPSYDFEYEEKLMGDEEAYSTFEAITHIVHCSGNLMDIMKRTIYYGKPLAWRRFKDEIGKIENMFMMICCNVTADQDGSRYRNEVRRRNIAKLAKRYPDKFNATDAVNRDLAEERKVLESDTLMTSDLWKDNYRSEDQALKLPPGSRERRSPSYNRLCSQCGINPIHKTNQIGICTDCYVRLKPLPADEITDGGSL